MIRTVLALAVVASVATGPALAEGKQISWGDLLPQHMPLEHPLADVEISVREDLARLARIRIDVEQGFLQPDSPEVAEAQALRQARLSAGVDLQALERSVTAFEAEIERRSSLTNTALDGERVRMPGYALPLEFSADGATELFLVPYVGACIHVPPPPPNQIVSISLDDPLKVASMFEPVWVTGRLQIETARQSLTLVDGSADIAYGYRLTEVQIEPYN